MRRAIMLMIAVLMLAPLVVGAQTTTMSFTYTWTAPTTGNAAKYYEFQVSSDNGLAWTSKAGNIPTNSYTVLLDVGKTWVVRVRAIDAIGQVGGWSVLSDPNTPNAGPPGACGKPGWL